MRAIIPLSDRNAMKNITSNLTVFVINYLIILWLYAALSKLFDFIHFQKQMGVQVFPQFVSTVLVWLLPALELTTAGILIFANNKKTGLSASLILITIFTAYIILIVLHVFDRVPCSCGGLFEKMGWRLHLAFNLLTLLLNLACLKYYHKERRSGDKE
jgi:putative oxidoreductase